MGSKFSRFEFSRHSRIVILRHEMGRKGQHNQQSSITTEYFRSVGINCYFSNTCMQKLMWMEAV